MNIKSLLIGSAAALAAVSGAQAADAIVAAEPEPLEYVRVCDAFGTGFFYIPGTETCLKFGGYVRFQVDVNRGNGDSIGTAKGGYSDWDAFTRAQFEVDTRTTPSSALCVASSASAATLTTALPLVLASSLTRHSSNSAA